MLDGCLKSLGGLFFNKNYYKLELQVVVHLLVLLPAGELLNVGPCRLPASWHLCKQNNNISWFLTLVPIWFPHCPAWMWTISRIFLLVCSAPRLGGGSAPPPSSPVKRAPVTTPRGGISVQSESDKWSVHVRPFKWSADHQTDVISDRSQVYHWIDLLDRSNSSLGKNIIFRQWLVITLLPGLND